VIASVNFMAYGLAIAELSSRTADFGQWKRLVNTSL